MENVQEQLRQRDGQLREATQQLTSVQGQLQERDGQLRQTTQQLTNVQRQLQESDGQLRQMTQQLSNVQGQMFEREMSIASKCRHPCLLQFIGATNDEGSPLFVTELMETSLRKLLEQRSLSTAEVVVISLDVARALNYLHQKKPRPIIHRDISSANVLLWRQADQWRGKVSDYGAANFMQHTLSVCPGAAVYSAPEALTKKQTVKVCRLLNLISKQRACSQANLEY